MIENAMIRSARAGLVIGVLVLGSATAQAITAEWDGGGGPDTDWFNDANWLNATPPTNVSDTAKISGSPYEITFSGGTNANLAAINLLLGSMTISGGSFNADSTYPNATHIGGTAGQVATLNQTGGSAQFQNLEIGYGNGFEGIYNISGGDAIVSGASRLSLYSVFLGRTDTGSGAGIGTIEISGGTFSTRQGVQVGGSGTLDGVGVFSVLGSGADEIDIGGYDTNNVQGGWYQYSNSTLRVGIDSGGITPIQISGGNAVFAEGSILDVSFLGEHVETNQWTIMNTDGMLTDARMGFASTVDTNLWNFGVTNGNSLWVTYGMGGYSPATNDVPPEAGRSLYWTGLAGTTDPLDKDNWATDISGTPATWGVYDDDNWFIGDSDIITDPETISVVDYDGGAAFTVQDRLEVGMGRTGILNFNDEEIRFSYAGINTIGGRSADGTGTLNLNSGTLWITRVRVGSDGAQGSINIDGGDLTINNMWSNAADGRNAGTYIGYGSTGGTGTINVVSGSMVTRGGVCLGVLGDTGIFSVQGSAADFINIGTLNTVDGFWYQSAGSVLKARIDEGGVTPIFIDDKGGSSADVTFESGSILDLGWMPGVTNYGTFDVMTWEGDLASNGLSLATSVDTNIWSFSFADTDSDGTNDTLRATAYGETANGTPFPWLSEYGLTEVDDQVDNDGDGLLTWEEYVAGTVPTNTASVLEVNSLASIGTDYVITWQSVEGKSYSIITNTSLTFPVNGVEATGIIGLPTETSYTSSFPTASSVFYEIGVE
jgi:hypothetical protein